MNKIVSYLNPIEHLGDKSRPILFPIVTIISFCVLIEIIVNRILKNPDLLGLYAIFIPIILIIYFAFRAGIRAAVISTIITVLYYCYIMYNQHYSGQKLIAGIESTFILGLVYLFISTIIGWLKQTIDTLIEREANEKMRLQTIIQQLPVGIIITDDNAVVVQTNKKVNAILGSDVPPGYRIGKDALLKSLHNNKEVTPTDSPLIQAMNKNSPVVGLEYTVQRNDGKQAHIQVSATTVQNKDKKMIAGAVIINDVTEQKEIEFRKDDFVNMASHELKTPLTSMKLYIDLLLNQIKKYNDEKALKMVKSIKYQTERLQELTSDLLDVSRIQTGKLSLHQESFDLVSLIKETASDLQASTDNHSISFSYDRPVKVYADKFRIYQVITNLLTNAIKYSPPNTEIKINLNNTNDEVIVSVQDSGIGIAKDQQEKIFERLYQVTDPTEKTFPGLGMGLYISKEIVSRHNGKIQVESEKGNGSVFYFTLPKQ